MVHSWDWAEVLLVTAILSWFDGLPVAYVLPCLCVAMSKM